MRQKRFSITQTSQDENIKTKTLTEMMYSMFLFQLFFFWSISGSRHFQRVKGRALHNSFVNKKILHGSLYQDNKYGTRYGGSREIWTKKILQMPSITIDSNSKVLNKYKLEIFFSTNNVLHPMCFFFLVYRCSPSIYLVQYYCCASWDSINFHSRYYTVCLVLFLQFGRLMSLWNGFTKSFSLIKCIFAVLPHSNITFP